MAIFLHCTFAVAAGSWRWCGRDVVLVELLGRPATGYLTPLPCPALHLPRTLSPSRISTLPRNSTTRTFSNQAAPPDPARAESEVLFYPPQNPKIVMADSRMSGNVDVPLAQSVVDQSTTDVDANTAISAAEANTVGAQNTKGEDATDGAEADAKPHELCIDAAKTNGMVSPADVRGGQRGW